MGHGGRGHAHAATRALRVLEDAGVAYSVLEYQHDASARSYGGEAVAKLDRDPAHVFKTLMVRADESFVIGVIPVDHRLSLKAVARAAGAKAAHMAEPAVAERRTGYVVGGISPLGQTTRHPTFIDSSARALETMIVSAGKRGLDVELTPADLLALTGGGLAPLTV